MPAGDRHNVYRSATVSVDFQLNARFFRRLAVGRRLRHAVHETVVRVALPYAISISPRSNAEHRHYQDSFEVQDGIVGNFPADLIIGRPPMYRVSTRLLNTVEHAAAVEWGNHRTPRGHHVLRRTLEHLSALPHDDNPHA